MVQQQDAAERLGPAERIIQTLTSFSDHLYHGRPGVVTPAPNSAIGVEWKPCTHKVESGDGNVKVVYRMDRVGKKTVLVKLGPMDEVGYRAPGLFPEVAAWMYRQIAEVWKRAQGRGTW